MDPGGAGREGGGRLQGGRLQGAQRGGHLAVGVCAGVEGSNGRGVVGVVPVSVEVERQVGRVPLDSSGQAQLDHPCVGLTGGYLAIWPFGTPAPPTAASRRCPGQA